MPQGPKRITPPHRNGYSLAGTGPGPDIDPALRPALSPGRNPNTETDAFAEWQAHLDAGRIAVR